MTMRMTTDAEQELAQAMHDALIPIVQGHDAGEVFNALFALLMDAMDHQPDPRAEAEQVIESIRANFPHG